VNAGITQADQTAFNWLVSEDTWVPTFGDSNQKWIERYALAVFFQDADGPNWNNNKNIDWKGDGILVCDWAGVSCDLDEMVTELTLRGFVGRINSYTYNTFSGTISSSLAWLTSLTHLNFLFGTQQRMTGFRKVDEFLLP